MTWLDELIGKIEKTEEDVGRYKQELQNHPDNLEAKIVLSKLQQSILSVYWVIQQSMKKIDVTGFPVRILIDTSFFVPSDFSGVSHFCSSPVIQVPSYNFRKSITKLTCSKGTLGILLNIKNGIHLVGAYDRIEDKFVTKYKLRLTSVDYTLDLTSEERLKVENARKKFIFQKYKKDNLKVVEKLHETK